MALTVLSCGSETAGETEMLRVAESVLGFPARSVKAPPATLTVAVAVPLVMRAGVNSAV